MKKITIGLADDHQLFLKSLGLMIESFKNFTILAEALNGKQLIDKLSKLKTQPDIILLDVNMPIMDGPATAEYLAQHYPQIKVVALSMKDDDTTIISMLKSGTCAYLLKDMHPDILEKALNEIAEKGYFNADAANINYRRLLTAQKEAVDESLSPKEREFIQLACSDLTYSNIASTMKVAISTVDGYRGSVFQKLNVQSRVGMVLEALRRNLVTL
jgi:DNA-binding NarL/FixJ family response regulator